jgi:hypothetical protein
VTLTGVLRACKVSDATNQLKGTRITLKRKKHGRFVQIASKRVNDRCRAKFSRATNFKRAIFKAVWEKQRSGFRVGASLPLLIKTH